MRCVTYGSPATSGRRVSIVDGDEIRGLVDDGQLIDLLGDDGARLAAAANSARRDPYEVVPLATAVLTAPVPTPPSVRDFMAFEAHVTNSMRALGRDVDPDWGRGPGQQAPGRRRPASGRRRGAHRRLHDPVRLEARDVQMREMRQLLGPVKGKDSATSLGLALEHDTPSVLSRQALETRHRLLVEALVDAGYTVLPVNPDLIARRRGPAKSKDDAQDAWIACLLALDQHW